MNEPLDPLPSEVTELFDEERRAPGLSSAAKDRVFTRLAAIAPIAASSPSGGGESAGTGGSSAATQAATATTAKAVMTKIGLTALALGVGGLGGAGLQARYAPLPTRAAPSVNVVASAAPRTDPISILPSTPSTLPIATAAEVPPPIVTAPRTAAAASPASASGRDDGLRR